MLSDDCDEYCTANNRTSCAVYHATRMVLVHAHLHWARLSKKASTHHTDSTNSCGANFKNSQIGQVAKLPCLPVQITTKQNYEKKQKLPELSKAVAVAVSDVIQSAEVLKGKPHTTHIIVTVRLDILTSIKVDDLRVFVG